MVGEFWSEQLVILEAANVAGAMQLAGAYSVSGGMVSATLADYSLLSEEMYAAGAYCSKRPAEIGSVTGSDYIKLVMLGILVIGAIAAIGGMTDLLDLIG
jgi:hypothetical protein